MINQLSLVIPAYNEGETIWEVVTAAQIVLTHELANFEIIVVDDGSDDGTPLLAHGGDAKVVLHPVNLGYGNALKTGILAAKYDHVAICDADATYNIVDFAKLLPHAKDFDMVVGARTGKEFHGRSIARRIARWFQLKLVQFTVGQPVPDVNSGMRIFKKANLLNYFDVICGGFSFTTSVTLAMLSTGKSVKYVPISYSPRAGTSHVHFVRDTLRSLQILMQAMLRYNPIKAFLTVMILPMLLGIYCLVDAVWAHNDALLLGFVLSMLTCVVLFGMGMLAFATQHGSKEAKDE